MPRLSVMVTVVVLAVALALYLGNLVRKGEDTRGRDGTPARLAAATQSGRAPSFHLHLTPEQRLQIARACLDGLTSAQPRALGAVKDDLALLADDPAVIRMILDDHAQRVRISRYEASGFGDIFARVKHPEFVPLTARLFEHDDFSVRHKALMAAETQAGPSLTPHLDRLFQEIVKDRPGEGIKTLVRIVHAGQACGGDHFPVLAARAASNGIDEVRGAAADAIRACGNERLAPRLRPLLQDANPQVRILAAWAIASFGDARGRDLLVANLDPHEKGLTMLALEAIRQLRLEEAVPRLLELESEADGDLVVAVRMALVWLGHEKTLAALRDVLEDPAADLRRRGVALGGLAVACEDVDLPTLVAVAREGTIPEIHGICAGLDYRRAPPPVELARPLVSGGQLHHTALLGGWFHGVGDGLVPWLGGQLDDAGTPNRATFVIGCLGLIGSEAARKAILARHSEWPNLVEQQIRLMDLDLRKQGAGT